MALVSARLDVRIFMFNSCVGCYNPLLTSALSWQLTDTLTISCKMASRQRFIHTCCVCLFCHCLQCTHLWHGSYMVAEKGCKMQSVTAKTNPLADNGLWFLIWTSKQWTLKKTWEKKKKKKTCIFTLNSPLFFMILTGSFSWYNVLCFWKLSLLL